MQVNNTAFCQDNPRKHQQRAFQNSPKIIVHRTTILQHHILLVSKRSPLSLLLLLLIHNIPNCRCWWLGRRLLLSKLLWLCLHNLLNNQSIPFTTFFFWKGKLMSGNDAVEITYCARIVIVVLLHCILLFGGRVNQWTTFMRQWCWRWLLHNHLLLLLVVIVLVVGISSNGTSGNTIHCNGHHGHDGCDWRGRRCRRHGCCCWLFLFIALALAETTFPYWRLFSADCGWGLGLLLGFWSHIVVH